MRPAVNFSRQRNEPLAGAVAGNLLGGDVGTGKREAACEFGAQFLRYAGHLVEIANAADIKPMPRLLDAHAQLRRRNPSFCERFAESGARQMIAVIADTGDTGSIALHEAFGFTVAGRLRAVGYKDGRWIDTMLMQRAIS